MPLADRLPLSRVRNARTRRAWRALAACALLAAAAPYAPHAHAQGGPLPQVIPPELPSMQTPPQPASAPRPPPQTNTRINTPPAGADMQTTIDDDLQTQANAEMAAGHAERALELLNELVERDPRRAGALLDAALLHCRLGERDLTRQTLARIESRYKVPPAIEKVIQFYKANTCTSAVQKPQLIASVRAGVTSNANFGPSNPVVTFANTAPFQSLVLAPASLAHSDEFVESALQGELPVRAVPGLSLFGGLTQRQYRDQHDYDQRIASIGAAHQYVFTHGTVENQAAADMFWLGSHLYQTDVSLHTGYWSPAAAWRTSMARAGIDFTVTDTSYPGNSLYDGVRFELRAAAQARVGERATLQFFAGPVWEAASGNRPGASRHGYTFWLSLDYDLGRYGQFEALAQRRTLIDAAPYDPVFFGGAIQNQTMQALSLQYAYPLTPHWSLFTRVSVQRISDTIEPFAYSVREASVGVSWKY
jgi:hypothetical protein